MNARAAQQAARQAIGVVSARRGAAHLHVARIFKTILGFRMTFAEPWI